MKRIVLLLLVAALSGCAATDLINPLQNSATDKFNFQKNGILAGSLYEVDNGKLSLINVSSIEFDKVVQGLFSTHKNTVSTRFDQYSYPQPIFYLDLSPGDYKVKKLISGNRFYGFGADIHIEAGKVTNLGKIVILPQDYYQSFSSMRAGDKMRIARLTMDNTRQMADMLAIGRPDLFPSVQDVQFAEYNTPVASEEIQRAMARYLTAQYYSNKKRALERLLKVNDGYIPSFFRHIAVPAVDYKAKKIVYRDYDLQNTDSKKCYGIYGSKEFLCLDRGNTTDQLLFYTNGEPSSKIELPEAFHNSQVLLAKDQVVVLKGWESKLMAIFDHGHTLDFYQPTPDQYTNLTHNFQSLWVAKGIYAFGKAGYGSRSGCLAQVDLGKKKLKPISFPTASEIKDVTYDSGIYYFGVGYEADSDVGQIYSLADNSDQVDLFATVPQKNCRIEKIWDNGQSMILDCQSGVFSRAKLRTKDSGKTWMQVKSK